jgi:anti-anti-sigma factor
MSRTRVLPVSIATRQDGAQSLPFDCSWTDCSPGAALVHLAGVLDFGTVSQLARTLHELGASAQVIVLDLRELVRIDFFGVHAIANACTSAREIGRRVVLLRVTPEIDRMFTLAGRLEDVEIGDLEAGELADEALRRFATSAPHFVPASDARRRAAAQTP